MTNESKGQIEKFEEAFKQDDVEIASCDTNILKWDKETKELQSKVKKVKERKAKLKSVSRKNLDEEDLIGLQHFDNVSALDAEIEGITSIISLTDIRLEATKARFDKLKAIILF